MLIMQISIPFEGQGQTPNIYNLFSARHYVIKHSKHTHYLNTFNSNTHLQARPDFLSAALNRPVVIQMWCWSMAEI